MTRTNLPDLICRDCGAVHAVNSLVWRCTCGGVLDIRSGPESSGPVVQPSRDSLWRYESALPVDFDERISLGEGMSPLVRSRSMQGVRFKLDFLMPTLSFKDRGAVVLAVLAARLDVRSALTDSSGNAGTAVAAYFSRAGIPCRVYVPETTSVAKLAQMRAHSAEVVRVAGTRADTAAAARVAATEPGSFYASHIYHPYFLHGVKTYGYEIWEQCGRRLPDTVVVPVGNGTLAIGCHLAFRELVGRGLADRMPTLVAVQAAACAPVADAYRAGAGVVTADLAAQPTIAEGIAIADPPRGAQILSAVRDTGGSVVTVTEDEIAAARAELAAEGLYVEPTSAVCWAAIRRPESGISSDDVIVPLCGAGVKAPAH